MPRGPASHCTCTSPECIPEAGAIARACSYYYGRIKFPILRPSSMGFRKLMRHQFDARFESQVSMKLTHALPLTTEPTSPQFAPFTWSVCASPWTSRLTKLKRPTIHDLTRLRSTHKRTRSTHDLTRLRRRCTHDLARLRRRTFRKGSLTRLRRRCTHDLARLRRRTFRKGSRALRRQARVVAWPMRWIHDLTRVGELLRRSKQILTRILLLG